MFDDDDEQETGITAELLVSDLRQNGGGYVLEVTTEGVEDKVVAEGHFLGDANFGELDFGETNEINDLMGTHLSSEHAIRITNKDREQLTIYAEGDRLLSLRDGDDEVEEHDTESELVRTVECFLS